MKKQVAYVDGELVSESPSSSSYNYVGMYRPTFDQVTNNQIYNNLGNFHSYSPIIHEWWLAGQYDKPIYKKIKL